MAGASFSAMMPRIRDPHLEYIKYLNFLVALRERRQKTTVVSSLPFDLTVDLSMACQLRCPYCATGTDTLDRPPVHLKPEMNDRILAAVGDQAFLIWYYCCGEPLLNPRYAEILAAAAKREIFTVVSTNLSFPLSDAKIDATLRSGLGMMCVALDGTTPETYVKYRRGGDFNLVVDNLRRLIRRKRELGLEHPIFEWRFLLFRHNQNEVARVYQMAEEIGVDSVDFFYGYASPDATADQVQPAIAPVAGTGGGGPAVRDGVLRTDTTLRRWLGAKIVEMPSEGPSHLMCKKCDWHYYGSMIHPDGRVGPCCAVAFATDDFGTLPEPGEFPRMWNSPNFQKARRMFSQNEPSDLVCARCPLPVVMDGHFLKCINGILGNAPDWALAVLAADSAAFFLDVDFHFLPTAARLAATRREHFAEYPQVVAQLRSDAKGDTPRHAHLREILRLLAPPQRNIVRRLRLDEARRLAAGLIRPITDALRSPTLRRNRVSKPSNADR